MSDQGWRLPAERRFAAGDRQGLDEVGHLLRGCGARAGRAWRSSGPSPTNSWRARESPAGASEAVSGRPGHDPHVGLLEDAQRSLRCRGGCRSAARRSRSRWRRRPSRRCVARHRGGEGEVRAGLRAPRTNDRGAVARAASTSSRGIRATLASSSTWAPAAAGAAGPARRGSGRRSRPGSAGSGCECGSALLVRVPVRRIS